MIKAEFSASLLQSSVSHDPLEIILIWWFAAQESFLIIISLNTVVVLHIFCGNCDTVYFSELYDEDRSKEQKMATSTQTKVMRLFNIHPACWYCDEENKQASIFKCSYHI